jgi:hypothetical protein
MSDSVVWIQLPSHREQGSLRLTIRYVDDAKKSRGSFQSFRNTFNKTLEINPRFDFGVGLSPLEAVAPNALTSVLDDAENTSGEKTYTIGSDSEEASVSTCDGVSMAVDPLVWTIGDSSLNFTNVNVCCSHHVSRLHNIIWLRVENTSIHLDVRRRQRVRTSAIPQ